MRLFVRVDSIDRATLFHKTVDLNDRDFLVRNLYKKTY